jgi:uncharacterized RDD family membrane protein YckC
MGTSYGPGTLYCAECGRPASADELARFGDFLICPDCKNNYAQKLREGVAPQAAMAYGGFWIRFLAVLIDGVIMFVMNTILDYALRGSVIPAVPVPEPGNLGALWRMMPALGITTLVNMTLDALYEGLFVGYLGATPGKMALGLKVVRPDGSPIGMGRSFGRHFAKILSYIILLIGYIMAGFDSEKRALHDLICDTRVVKTR